MTSLGLDGKRASVGCVRASAQRRDRALGSDWRERKITITATATTVMIITIITITIHYPGRKNVSICLQINYRLGRAMNAP